jgi:hypothetical protein
MCINFFLQIKISVSREAKVSLVSLDQRRYLHVWRHAHGHRPRHVSHSRELRVEAQHDRDAMDQDDRHEDACFDLLSRILFKQCI